MYVIISFIVFIFCVAMVFVSIAKDELSGVIVFFILTIISAFIVRYHIEKFKLNHGVVENVIEYQIDSTLVIKGGDTTKVYTIGYIKQ